MEEPTVLVRQQQAHAALSRGQNSEALRLLDQALALDSGNPETWYQYGYVLKALGHYEQALDAYGRAVTLGLSRPEEAHVNRGIILSDHLRRDQDAAAELEFALKANPNYLPALLNQGNLFEECGQRDQALAVYRRVLDSEIGRGDPHADLRLEARARIAKLDPPRGLGDASLEALRLAATAPASTIVRANVLFALGHSYDLLNDADAAFGAYARANRWLIRGRGRLYDRGRLENYFSEIREAFSTPANADGHDGAAPRPAPVFICGMFRSGSTLVEQVLAAHSDVYAGGELDLLPRLAVEDLSPFPSSIRDARPEFFASLGEGYRRNLARLFPAAAARQYLTDKRPDNFALIGLIKLMLPDARIIHTTRNPVDNGLSIFMQHLQLDAVPYSADLSDIGHYYGEYRRLMAHWTKLYPDAILEFDYDAFVGNPRPALSRLMEFLKLPFEDSCLEFHRLDNTVKTASYWQVRQPLNTNASGRWRRYQQHLAPLLAELEQQGLAID